MGPSTLPIFGRDEGGVTGALVYLNANPSLDAVLSGLTALELDRQPEDRRAIARRVRHQLKTQRAE